MSPFTELTYAAALMKGGFSPLWNPLLSCGTPLFAQPGLALGYPGTLLLLMLPAGIGQCSFLALHLALAYVGALDLAKMLELRLPARIFALLYAFVIGALGFKMHPSFAAGFAWLPWVVLSQKPWQKVGAWAMLLSTAEPVSCVIALLVTMMAARGPWKELGRHFLMAGAMTLAILLPTLEAAMLTVATPLPRFAQPLSAAEAGMIKQQSRETRVDADLSSTAAVGASEVPGPAWAGGSRRPTRHLALLQSLLSAEAGARDAQLGLLGVSTLLSRDAAGLKRVQLHAPFRAAFVNSARLQNNSPETLSLTTKPFYSRPLLLDSSNSSLDSSALGAAWTMVSMQGNALGETSISLPANQEKGWLYLSDAYYPGWVARVDGRSRPIVRAEGAFRAVEINPRDKNVQFLFRPWSFYLGWGISLLMMFLCVYKSWNPQSLR